MSHDRNHHRGGPSRWWLTATILTCLLVLIPILYVLSIGPVAMMAERGVLPDSLQPVFEIVYFPVIMLHEYTPLKEPLEWYVELWV